jgi:hypothetical protein
MVNTRLFVELEEYFNRNITCTGTDAKDLSKVDNKILGMMDEYINERKDQQHENKPSLYKIILKYIERMKEQGYLDSNYFHKNGELKEATFYNMAQIDKSTWNGIRWGTLKPSKKTLLKLVLALRLDQNEAEQLLRLEREEFDKEDIQDWIIEGIIALREKFEISMDDAVFILYEYQQMYKDSHPFDCIFETATDRKQRKEKEKQKK